MSFQKFNVCDSTLTAVSVFHLFQNGLINMVETYDEHDDHNGFKRYEPESKDLETLSRFDMSEVVSRLTWYCAENVGVKVHNLFKTSKNKIRIVEFSLTRDDSTNTTFIVAVKSELLEVEGHSARWSSWTLDNARLSHSTCGITMEMVMQVVRLNREDLQYLPAKVAEDIGGYVVITSSSF